MAAAGRCARPCPDAMAAAAAHTHPRRQQAENQGQRRSRSPRCARNLWCTTQVYNEMWVLHHGEGGSFQWENITETLQVWGRSYLSSYR